MTTSALPSELPAPLILADHPALDLLNTQMMVEGKRRDLLNSDEDAARWLEQVGLGLAAEWVAGDGRLLAQLRRLRDGIESLIGARRENRSADPAPLNAFLLRAVPQLVWDPSGHPVLERFHQDDAVARRLGQLAYASAELLAEGDFRLVRKCESPECSLMFYDRTKSHKRRWCSMALCGNRHKVAEFRKRRQGAAD
ncbi:CGNR zinc finger domain-containing protein [Pseudomonas gingeri]|uniref:CGNR zinc finger domain-containing protein n=1 Tax=Pseudomonas gingeri TaxID=117681 RepID=A0A7Y7YD83_9PSED|nr:ABATE domain-containing protein [Pseudomonas gingeri]NVZ99111.1 CGNR zinc finger domain-containing protein [Pseudomonas gingeri]NWA13156.1 CGNR zinc finger domain-containing protein [Pseudomonas gingeri]NWA55417.1 CGNR zinc finger domain-containing protein [Pseudomonas gingeri]NWA95729.1 CGNR zinc finger domain-containing protein [Pseudomonas gingeri]NWB00817.1 CGNR zinc finger domain-containing protein [Pseudomonas gingeri]